MSAEPPVALVSVLSLFALVSALPSVALFSVEICSGVCNYIRTMQTPEQTRGPADTGGTIGTADTRAILVVEIMQTREQLETLQAREQLETICCATAHCAIINTEINHTIVERFIVNYSHTCR